MSTIGVKYHKEDIHNIIPKPLPPIVRYPLNKEELRSFITSEINKEKKRYNGHQTFGLARYDAPEFSNYLRKGKSRAQLPAVKYLDKKEFQCTKCCKNAPVPKHSVAKTTRTEKNFVKENIKKIAAIEPKLPPPRKVETPRGTVKDMAHLLQMIRIRQNGEYGRIPKYLCDRKKKWVKEKERKDREEKDIQAFKEKMGIGLMGLDENVYMIDNEMRQKLLDGLKENWTYLSNQFLKLPVLIDTWTKIRRKMWLEKEIDQLEKDVRLVENHPYIYIERTDRRPYAEIIADQKKREKEEQLKKEMENKENEPEKEPEKEANVLEKGEEPDMVDDKKEEDEGGKRKRY